MRTLVLRLEGPMQAWGTQGRFGIRDTDREPSKSGVLGLVGAALGMPRDDVAQLARLRTFRFGVRVDREGTLLRDYHTAGAGRFRGEDYRVHGTKNPVVTERWYLAGASFTAALGSDDHVLVEEVEAAFHAPRWPLYLGRKACVPSAPPLLTVLDEPPLRALQLAPAALGVELPARMRVVIDAEGDEPSDERRDDPLAFTRYARAHASRRVVTRFVDLEPHGVAS